MFVCILPEKAVTEMTYTVSGGTLNPTHSLTLSPQPDIGLHCQTADMNLMHQVCVYTLAFFTCTDCTYSNRDVYMFS